jgi:hypothetical protein
MLMQVQDDEHSNTEVRRSNNNDDMKAILGGNLVMKY